jgi:hypothetical protein
MCWQVSECTVGGVEVVMVDRIRVFHEAVRPSLQLRREPLPNDADPTPANRLFLGKSASREPFFCCSTTFSFHFARSYIIVLTMTPAIGEF